MYNVNIPVVGRLAPQQTIVRNSVLAPLPDDRPVTQVGKPNVNSVNENKHKPKLSNITSNTSRSGVSNPFSPTSNKTHNIREIYKQLKFSEELCGKEQLDIEEHKAVSDTLNYLGWAGEEIGRLRQILSREYVEGGCFNTFLHENQKRNKGIDEENVNNDQDTQLVGEELCILQGEIKEKYAQLGEFAKKYLISSSVGINKDGETTARLKREFNFWNNIPEENDINKNKIEEILWNEIANGYEVRWNTNGYAAILSDGNHHYCMYAIIDGQHVGILRSHVGNNFQWYIHDPENYGQKIELKRESRGEFTFAESKTNEAIEYIRVRFELPDKCLKFDTESGLFNESEIVTKDIDILAYCNEDWLVYDKQETVNTGYEIKTHSTDSLLTSWNCDNTVLPQDGNEEDNVSQGSVDSQESTGNTTPMPGSKEVTPVQTLRHKVEFGQESVLDILPEEHILLFDSNVLKEEKLYEKKKFKRIKFLPRKDLEVKRYNTIRKREEREAIVEFNLDWNDRKLPSEMLSFLAEFSFPGKSSVKSFRELRELAAQSTENVKPELVDDIEFAREIVLNFACSSDPKVRKWVERQLPALYKLDPVRIANLSVDVIRFLEPELPAPEKLGEQIDLTSQDIPSEPDKTGPPYLLAFIAAKALQPDDSEYEVVVQRLRRRFAETRGVWEPQLKDEEFRKNWGDIVQQWKLLAVQKNHT